MEFTGIKVIEKGRRVRDIRDFFYWTLRLSWGRFLALSVGAYWALNVFFAVFYWAVGNEFTNSDPHSFFQALAFSFQTSSTVGYGYFAPTGHGTMVISFLELTISLFFVAAMTGLFFARIARPRARLEFSKNLLVTNIDGVPHLMFRVANGRSTHISNASIRVAALVPYVSKEGEHSRRFIDLKLFRSESPIFAFTWSVLHKLDESSPLSGLEKGHEKFPELELFISLTGFESALSQTVHTSHRYRVQDMVWNRNFADIIHVASDGTRTIDFEKFHHLK